MNTNEQKEKKSPRLTELFAFVSVMVSIIIAGTSLLNYSGNVPLWWFHFSFIVLIALTFFTPLMVFAQPISERFKKFTLKRKRNAIAHKYFAEFKEIVDGFGSASYSIFEILDNLRSNFEPKIREKMGLLPIYLIQVHNRNDVDSPLHWLKERFKENNETFRELTLLNDQLNIILQICEKTIKLNSEFVREIKKEYQVPEHIEREYEESREKYNDFIKNYERYCHKLNQELGERVFSEHFDLAKKW